MHSCQSITWQFCKKFRSGSANETRRVIIVMALGWGYMSVKMFQSSYCPHSPRMRPEPQYTKVFSLSGPDLETASTYTYCSYLIIYPIGLLIHPVCYKQSNSKYWHLSFWWPFNNQYKHCGWAVSVALVTNKKALFVTLTGYLKNTKANFSPNSTNTLCLRVTQMPKSRDLTICYEQRWQRLELYRTHTLHTPCVLQLGHMLSMTFT